MTSKRGHLITAVMHQSDSCVLLAEDVVAVAGELLDIVNRQWKQFFLLDFCI